MWFQRDIERSIRENHDPIQIFRGPRQVGKSSLILHLDEGFREVSLDDPGLRELAERDPELFLRQFGSDKLFIDEAQYAPRLFPSLKRRADLYSRDASRAPETIVRLTGSNQLVMDRRIKESLAGRASFFDMNTLSVAEIVATRSMPIQDILFTGGWPGLHAHGRTDVKKYLDDYINSYVEKDIVLGAGIHKQFEFLKFIRLLAGRVGQLLDLASLGRDAGVDSKTIKDWISILERMQLIALVQPFSTNLSSRLVKAPKVYFLDTGLACRLQGWTSADQIITSPQQGPLFENLVYAELHKTNQNHQLGWQICHWRSRDGEEIDFLVELSRTSRVFIEAKVSAHRPWDPHRLREVTRVFGSKAPPLLCCHQEGDRVFNQNVPIAHLQQLMLEAGANPKRLRA